jgi:hypothetical protein
LQAAPVFVTAAAEYIFEVVKPEKPDSQHPTDILKGSQNALKRVQNASTSECRAGH